MKADFLIIGQGLAGSMLAWSLLQEGKSVVVADKGPSASRVAAGMFNPVTGRRFAKSWKIDELLPFAEDAYRQLEGTLNTSFLHKKPMIRLFPSADERERIINKFHDWEGAAYIGEIFEPFSLPGYRHFEHGGCIVKDTGYLDTVTFLDSMRRYLREHNSLAEEHFCMDDARISEGGIEWNGISASYLIFCEGYTGAANPYFNHLPFGLVKGEVLTFSAPGLDEDYIINKNGYIVPIGNGIFKLGATYNWDDLKPEPTAGGEAELREKLSRLVSVPFSILDVQAGIRPTVKHRRPLAGMHGIHQNIGIFNGLGTKGVVLAPYFARQMAKHILYREPLEPEIDIHNPAVVSG